MYTIIRSHQICRFCVAFELKQGLTEVVLTNQTTGATVKRKVHAQYHRHLNWIQRRSSTEESVESRWYRNVMDCFAEELVRIGPKLQPNWRSPSLQPLLARAFNGLRDFDQHGIEKEVKWHYNDSKSSFYFGKDFLDMEFDERWDDLLEEEEQGKPRPYPLRFCTQ